MFNYYKIYNTIVKSSFDLPAPQINPTQEQIEILHSSSIHFPPSEHKDTRYYYDVTCSKGHAYYKDIGIFAFSQGKQILVKPLKGAAEAFLTATILTGPMGIALMQKGQFILHGSSVSVNDKAVAFLGLSGAGKSTAALTMVNAGYPLISDDVAAITQKTNNTPVVTAAYPWMKIDVAMAKLFDLPRSQMYVLQTGADKQRYSLPDNMFSYSNKPLACIYFLNWGDNFSIKKLSPREALINVVPNSYGPAPRTKYPEETRKYFLQLSSFIQSVPCFLLTRKRGNKFLHELPKAIDHHVSSLF